jgi:hypothetical protein
MLAPFDPDPECPFYSGEGFRRFVSDGSDQVGRCECTNWSSYAELRRAKGLTMKQALEALQPRRSPCPSSTDFPTPLTCLRTGASRAVRSRS